MKSPSSILGRLMQPGMRRLLWLTGALPVIAGLALGWEWLQAAGILSLALSVLPCLAMCALGLCMNRMCGKGDCASKSSSPEAAVADRPARQE